MCLLNCVFVLLPDFLARLISAAIAKLSILNLFPSTALQLQPGKGFTLRAYFPKRQR